MNGWIKLHRELQENPLWQDKPFSKGHAWIDLLLSANHSEKEFLIGSTVEKIERGNLITSELKLMERWGWSKNKVRRFLDYLQKENMIEKSTNRKRTAINIVNYGIYQNSQTEKEPQKNRKRTDNEPPTDCERATEEPQTIHKQESNNVKNDKESKNERTEEVITAEVEDVSRSEIQTILEAWNELQSYGIKPVSRLKSGTKRYSSLLARIKEYNAPTVLSAIENIKRSNFLQGKNNRGWVVTFDWFVLPNNFPKVLEGNYTDDNKQNNGMSYGGNSRDEQFQKLMEQIRRDEENANRGS